MKNIFPTFVITFIALVTFTQQAAAQKQDIMSFNLDDDTPDLSKPIIINLPEKAITVNAAKDSVTAINKKAVKDFQKAFKEVTNPSWYKTYDGGYIAQFTNGTVKNMIAYDNKGVWHHSIRKYNEKSLPQDVRAAVKSIYYDYTITGVDEVSLDEQLIYLICIQDESSLKTIRFSDGEMQEVQSVKKGQITVN